MLLLWEHLRIDRECVRFVLLEVLRRSAKSSPNVYGPDGQNKKRKPKLIQHEVAGKMC